MFFVCVRVCTRTDPDDLEESDSHGHNSDRKKILTSSPGTLTYGNINLGVFMTLVIHLPCENSILPNFSMLRGVAILDCDSHSQAGSTKGS